MVWQNANAWWNEDWRYRKAVDITLSAESRQSATSQTIPIRLHSGNFPYFFNLAEGGADIRIIANDDLTPLAYHIETLDVLMGLGLIWVQLPENLGNEETYRIWIYYDNPDAVSSADSTASYDAITTAVYHFSESTGLPRDSSAYSHHTLSSSGKSRSEGYHGDGIGLTPESFITLPDSPALNLNQEHGFSMEVWVKFDESGRILSYGNDEFEWFLSLENKTLNFNIRKSDQIIRLETTKNIVPSNWHHLAITWKDTLRLLLDGQDILNEAIAVESHSGSFIIGAKGENAAFTGFMDELKIFSQSRNDEWFVVNQALQNSSTTQINYLQDEEQSISAGSRILASLWPLLNNIGIAGWAVIAVLVIIGLIAADVMLTKMYFLSRVQKANHRFDHDCHENYSSNYLHAIQDENFNHSHSPYWRILETASKALKDIPEFKGHMPSLYVDSLRSSLDESLLEETNRINAHMVWINIAVSGGPFLGLLGTVIGVMITFATIAQSGDVNVNTIAPGVAAALTTTVLGLIVAIPALFGYNFLAGRIGRVIAELETYTEKLAVQLAIHQQEQDSNAEVLHAQAS